MTRYPFPLSRLAASLGALLLLLTACRPSPPTPSLPGTPVPATSERITAGNIGRLTELARWPVSGWVKYGLAFSPDGHTLALAFDAGVSGDTAIQLWDVATGRTTGGLAGLPGRIEGLTFSPDGQTFAAGSSNQTVKVWQIPSDQGNQIWTVPADVTSLAFTPDGKVLAVGLHDGTVQLREAGSGQVIRTLAAHSDLVSSVAFSPDGTRLATASFDHSLKLWDTSSGRALEPFREQQGVVWKVAWAPDGQTLASAGADGVQLWDAATGQVRTVLETKGEWFDVEFSADGTVVAAADTTSLGLWETASGRKLSSVGADVIGPSSLDTLAFSRDGKLLAAAGDHMAWLWGVR